MVKVYISCHQETYVPTHPMLYPIQVGTALAEKSFPGFLHDNVGEGISEKNRQYCELTAQYWVWKNETADFYGFFHYRRYLSFLAGKTPVYTIEKSPSDAVLQRYGYGTFPETWDVLYPKPEHMGTTVRQYYATSPYHHVEDLDLVVDILCRKHPDYETVARQYLAGDNHYFGNIFVMRHKAFHQYAPWLFDILFQFDQETKGHYQNTQEKRVNGYLAERLLGIYLTKLAQDGNVTMKPLSRIHFAEQAYGKKKLEQILLPANSKRRALVRAILRRNGEVS